MDRPINLKAHEVVAIMQGRKTQHRVAVNVAKYADYLRGYVSTGRLHAYYGDHRLGLEFVHAERGLWDQATNPTGLSAWYVPVPFHPSQRLWVREAWRIPDMDDMHSAREMAAMCAEVGYSRPWCATRYEADGARVNWDSDYGDPGRLRQAIHLPRWASRLTLLVTDVRVERLQAISRSDCYAEGCFRPDPAKMLGSDVTARGNARNEFRKLWDGINGDGAWARNDWVVVVTFRPIRANIDAPEAQEQAT